MNNTWLSEYPVYFTPPDGSSRTLAKDSPSPPAAPDYVGAAKATAEGNLQAAQTATAANRVNQYSPYGSSVYSRNEGGNADGPPEGWNQTFSLSPTGQSLLDAGNNSALGLAGLQQGATRNVAGTMGTPFNSGTIPGIRTQFDTSGVSAMPTADPEARRHAEDMAYGAAKSRLDPTWDTRSTQSDTQLRNQGIMPGTEAYTNYKRDENFAKNDAYQQAQAAAVGQGLQNQQAQFGMGMQANQAGFGQAQARAGFENASSNTALERALALRNQPLQELNALRTGSQVTNPTFSTPPQQGQVPGTNYSGAVGQQGAWDQGIYNAGVGQQNATTGGLFQLGGAALGAFAF